MTADRRHASARLPRTWLTVLGAALVGAVGGGLFVRLVLWPDNADVRESPVLPEGVYVALGDSYSAGEGLPPYQSGTEDLLEGDRCHRSAGDAYALHVWWEGMKDRRFRACAGAVVRQVFDEVQIHSDNEGNARENHQGLQAGSGVLTGDVTLVTITMGGNDVGFAKALKFCALVRPLRDSCVNRRFDPYDAFESDPTLGEWVEGRLAKLDQDLKVLYQRLRADAPNARVIVIGYPSLFPADVQLACLGERLFFNEAEREAFISYASTLNGLIRDRALEAGLEYLDTISLFSKHEPCGAGGSDWVRFPLSVGSIDGWFHPNETGQEKLARAVMCYLAEHPGAVDEVEVDTAPAGSIDVGTRTCFESSDSFPAPPIKVAVGATGA